MVNIIIIIVLLTRTVHPRYVFQDPLSSEILSSRKSPCVSVLKSGVNRYKSHEMPVHTVRSSKKTGSISSKAHLAAEPNSR